VRFPNVRPLPRIIIPPFQYSNIPSRASAPPFPVDYHLSIAGERTGPHTQFRVIEQIREGRLKGDELVWRVGMADWQPLRTMPEFDGFWPVSEEMRLLAEAARQKARAELDRPRPWLRFWARTLDRFWYFLLLGFAFNLFGLTNPQWLLDNTFLRIVVGVLALLLYVPIEAWLLTRFGYTPGRALLRIQVRRLDGALPHFSQALRRSFQVFVKGFAMGLPIIDFIAMLLSRLSLLQRGTTSWDEANETRVEHGEPEPWRYVVLAGIVLGVIGTMVILGAVVEEMSRLPN
jgi:uncharacterized RDD family membrane protein YckC